MGTDVNPRRPGKSDRRHERCVNAWLRIVRDRQDSTPELSEPLSFDAFFAAESQTLFRRMWLVTLDRHDAEEIVQDAFLLLYERWDRATSWEDPTAYLYRTAFNAWKNRSRRAARLNGGLPRATSDVVSRRAHPHLSCRSARSAAVANA
jgi:DNA-directed RNA polymerase specialized sigma24 family protein